MAYEKMDQNKNKSNLLSAHMKKNRCIYQNTNVGSLCACTSGKKQESSYTYILKKHSNGVYVFTSQVVFCK
jgi:hypothetical protein